jgi:hypothetical protein
MRVNGLFADQALTLFVPEQFVNVWDALTKCFHCEAQMNSLPAEVLEDPESYFLEPTDEMGIPMSLQKALQTQAELPDHN